MAIDFSQVKSLTIPEGSVNKITDSDGNTLWQGVGWHTIWEGNKTCTSEKNGYNTPVVSGAEENFVQTAVGTGYKPKIRITFSYSINNDNNNFNKRFYINDYRDAYFPPSPLIIDEVKTTYNNKNRLCGPCLGYKTGTGPDAYIVLKSDKDTENNRLIISLSAFVSNNINKQSGSFTITFTVTKIEQYY